MSSSVWILKRFEGTSRQKDGERDKNRGRKTVPFVKDRLWDLRSLKHVISVNGSDTPVRVFFCVEVGARTEEYPTRSFTSCKS